ncbi:hypothetical protein [Helicobacter pylori]|uniref:hypothetical protein n=1 Tax=Helicobacter pylori TaxID=210 RepID=UPI00165C0009|nr:hypothetical protein [Helicobacter pylori]
MLKRAKSVTDKHALSTSNDFKKRSKLSKIDKAKSLNKKTLKTKGTELLIFHSQNPKYPFVSCPLLVYGCFNM